jgi:isochorismate synthase
MQDSLKNKASALKAVQICVDRKINFAAYRLPDKKDFTLVVQKDAALREVERIEENIPAEGFLIAPFSRHSGNKTYLIRPDMVLHSNNMLTLSEASAIQSIPVFDDTANNDPAPDTEKADYLTQISEILRRIEAGEFEKVVLSRVKSVSGNYIPMLSLIFDTLCSLYDNAFVYLFCIRGQYWIGATFEPFVCSKNNMLCTVSLAGTRAFLDANQDLNNWNKKERLEQEYVTRHIEKVLMDYSVTGYTRQGPYVARAGNISHLRTDFNFSIRAAGDRLPYLIQALHPTPAVCGMDSGKAMDFISNAEKHNRGYYTGFLGPVGLDDLMQLYVNIRCMKVYADRLVLFTGGGITQDSIPEEEWEETEIKSDTLLAVISQLS